MCAQVFVAPRVDELYLFIAGSRAFLALSWSAFPLFLKRLDTRSSKHRADKIQKFVLVRATAYRLPTMRTMPTMPTVST